LLRLKGLPHIQKLLPGHGRLDIENDLLDEAIQGFDEISEKGRLEKGSGLHSFARLKIQL